MRRQKPRADKGYQALWKRPKLFLQSLGKPASRLQESDCELKVPLTFAHFRSGAMYEETEAQRGKGYQALWKRPKLFLQSLGKPASRLQASDCKVKVPLTFAQFISWATQAQADVLSRKILQAPWNSPKPFLQTLSKTASRLQGLDREHKVP